MEKLKDQQDRKHPLEEKAGLIEINSRQELKDLVDNIPEGVVYSIRLEVRITNE